MLKMSVRTVVVDIETNAPVIILKNEDGPGLLPIMVGQAEAQAIIFALNETKLPRPITYDLMRNILVKVGVELHRVVINKIHNSNLYSQLELRHGDNSFIVDSRPSDAIALALRTKSPIYCTEDVAIQTLVEDPDEKKEEELRKEFRKFLESLHPKDFGDPDEV